MGERKSSKPKKPKTARWQRIAMMDKEILDVEGAATLLGVSTTTIYNLARKGEIPATRVGREWRFARTNLILTVCLDVTSLVVGSYGCDDGRIGPTRCAVIGAGRGDR